ncbi:hypothetical protein C8J56DRAFT_973195, partial [Mycena floridula]
MFLAILTLCLFLLALPVALGLTLKLEVSPVTLHTLAIWQWSASDSDPDTFAFELGLVGKPDALYGITRFNQTTGQSAQICGVLGAHRLVAVDNFSDRTVLTSIDFDVVALSTTLSSTAQTTSSDLATSPVTIKTTASASAINHSSNVGAIAGGVLAGLFFLSTVFLVLFFYWKRRHQVLDHTPISEDYNLTSADLNSSSTDLHSYRVPPPLPMVIPRGPQKHRPQNPSVDTSVSPSDSVLREMEELRSELQGIRSQGLGIEPPPVYASSQAALRPLRQAK